MKAGVTLKRESTLAGLCFSMFSQSCSRKQGCGAQGPATLRDLSILPCTELCLQENPPAREPHPWLTSGPPGVVTSNLSAGLCPSFLQHAHGRVWKAVTFGRSTPSAYVGRSGWGLNRQQTDQQRPGGWGSSGKKLNPWEGTGRAGVPLHQVADALGKDG